MLSCIPASAILDYDCAYLITEEGQIAHKDHIGTKVDQRAKVTSEWDNVKLILPCPI